MADLSPANVLAKLPANSIIEDLANNDVRISMKAVMGEASVDLDDEKIGEFITKFLDACAAAQVEYNQSPDPDLRSYPNPTASAPIRNATTGEYASTFTYTVSLAIPLDKSVVTALQI
ncbi:hypothetical protein [Egbenema bharatensis]|uniref:hypothetical protein n=1 Tax=Egbenema bharatensis TaxID=3463334 RepID=UPI003A8A92DE